MGKRIAVIFAAAVFAMSLMSCAKPATAVTTEELEETTSDDDGTLYSPGVPSHNLSDATITKHLPDYYLEEFDAPWGSKYNLRMADTVIKNKFTYMIFDQNDNVINENLNEISTIAIPQIKIFPAEQEGYIMYEITYTQMIPIRSRHPVKNNGDMYCFYDLDFVDYYTGTKYPWVNIFSSDGKGSHIIQDYHYKDGTYRLEYYEFHDEESIDEGTTDEGNGIVFKKTLIKRTTTSYLIVPEDYDGILMYIYVGNDVFWLKDGYGDDNSESVDKDRQPYNVYDAEPFGDEEHINDYVFIEIAAPK